MKKPLAAQNVKCIFLNNQPCLVRPLPIDLNPNKLCYNPFVVNLDRCTGRSDNLDDLSDNLCVLNKTKDVGLKVLSIIRRFNEIKLFKNIFRVMVHVDLTIKNAVQNKIRTKINIGVTVKTTNKTTCM